MPDVAAKRRPALGSADRRQRVSQIGGRALEGDPGKPYAAMGGLHAPLDALFEIAARRPLVAGEIERVDVAEIPSDNAA